MVARLPVLFSSLSLTLSLLGCGEAPSTNYRTEGTSQADAVALRGRVSVGFTMPDRKAYPEITAAMNGVYYRLQGEGSDCPAGEGFEEVIPYVDGKTVFLHLTALCNYSVSLKLGALASAPAALALTTPPAVATAVSYEVNIKPLVAANCVSCHETYADYKELVSKGDMILARLEAGTMPQTGALPDADVATFLAWKDGGYVEKDPTPAATPKEKGLSAVYYENNKNDHLMTYELQSRIQYELRRSLWIQPDGEEKGFTVKEFQSFVEKSSAPTTTP